MSGLPSLPYPGTQPVPGPARWERGEYSPSNRPRFLDLSELAALVPTGARLGISGFHFSRLPIALIQEMVDQGVCDLDYVSWGGSLGLEMLLDAGAVRSMALCFNSLDVFGLAPRFRHALELGEVELEEWTALGMIQGFKAAAQQVPYLTFQAPVGSVCAPATRATGMPDGSRTVPSAPILEA